MFTSTNTYSQKRDLEIFFPSLVGESGEKTAATNFFYVLGNHLGNVLVVVSDRKIPHQSGTQVWIDEFTNNDAANQAATWNPLNAVSSTKSVDNDRLKFTSSTIDAGLAKTFVTPAATGSNYQLQFDLDKGTCTQIKIEVFTAPGQSTPVYSNTVSSSGTYSIPFTDQSAVAWVEIKKTADNGVSESFYLDNIKLIDASAAGTGVDYYTADVVSATDYYAFGMQMPGRSFNSNSTHYGFNGKEKDDEVNGRSNHYDYGFRIYNSD